MKIWNAWYIIQMIYKWMHGPQVFVQSLSWPRTNRTLNLHINGLVDSPHKALVMKKVFPCHYVIMANQVMAQRTTFTEQLNINLLSSRETLHFWKITCLFRMAITLLQWRHNKRDGVQNHQRRLFTQRLFRRRSKKTSKPRITGHCGGNSPVTSEFPSQRANNAENVSIWWRHHVTSRQFPCIVIFHIGIFFNLSRHHSHDIRASVTILIYRGRWRHVAS